MSRLHLIMLGKLEIFKKDQKRFLFRFLFNLYPPYLGAGIRVVYISKDYRTFVVKMPLRFYNYVR